MSNNLAATELFKPLTLPNGSVLQNRICKASMEENLSDEGQVPGDRLEALYTKWAEGGAGLILTGNVMISPDALTGPGGIVLENDARLELFRCWANAGRKHGSHFWMQINHPGRQVYAAMGEEAVSASTVNVNIPGYSKMFAKPRALTGQEIAGIIERFANTAMLAEQAGFTGVEIHAAHGYLINQFLSPLTNLRDDDWGGSLEKRARFLFEVIRAVRAKVSSKFCVAVKLNSADFQKGGFDTSDAKWVVERMNTQAVDLVELSGGSYESPAMQGNPQDGGSGKREAYFIDFARDIANVATMPIMVTGGIRRLKVACDAIKDDSAHFGVSVLGIARALAFEPNLPNNWRQNIAEDIYVPEVHWKNQTISAAANMALTNAQFERLGKGKAPKANLSPIFALIAELVRTKYRTRRYRAWRKSD